jgi:hypothetical protein
MREFLFDPAWWYVAALAMVGAGVFMAGNARLKDRANYAGIAVFLLALAWFAVAWMVETDGEQVVRGSYELVAAVEARDQTKVGTLLHAQAFLGVWNKADIVSGCKIYPDQFGLTDASVTGVELSETPPILVTVVSVITQHDSSKVPVGTIPSTWQLEWGKDPTAGWQVMHIDLVRVGRSEKDMILDREFQRKPVGP